MVDLDAATLMARMDRLPDSRPLRKIILLISVGGIFELYDAFLTAYIAPAFFRQKLFSPTTTSFFDIHGFASFVAALLLGLFVGNLGLGHLADKYGRRRVFTLSMMWYCIGTFIMAMQSTAESIVLWRFIASIGIGVESITLDAYVMEMAPRHRRGRTFLISQSIALMALPIVALLSWQLVPREPFGIDGWRWILVIGASGAVVALFLRQRLPESPRWLITKGRFVEADDTISRLEHAIEKRQGQCLPAPEVMKTYRPAMREVAASAWKPPYRRRMIMLLAFQILQPIGFYGFANWVPTLLMAHGITVTKSLQYSFLMAFSAPLGPLLGAWIADRFERKWQIVFAACAIGVLGLVFSQQASAVMIVLVGLLINLATNWLSMSYHAYQVELFPTSIRVKAVSFAQSLSRISALFASFVIAFMLRDYGGTGVLMFIAGCMLGVALVIGLFGPAVNGSKPDEEVVASSDASGLADLPIQRQSNR